MNLPLLPTAKTWGADCLALNVSRLPRDIPAIWPYVTGTPEVQWSDTEIAWFKNARKYRVNQHYGNDNAMDGDEFDIEYLAWTPDECVDVTRERASRSWSTRFYGTYATYGTTTAKLAAAGVRQGTWWRIADWNLDRHMADAALWGDVYAGQYASPTSNPDTVIPGTRTTLAEAQCDLNVLLIENTGL